MLTAVKGNREVKINEDQKNEFLKAGFDVIDEKGERTIAPSKTVPYAEVEKITKENEKLKKENEKLKKADVAKLVEENTTLKKEVAALKKTLEESQEAGV